MPRAINILSVMDSLTNETALLERYPELSESDLSIQSVSLNSSLKVLEQRATDIVICEFNGDDKSTAELHLLKKHASSIPIVTFGPVEVALTSAAIGSEDHVSQARDCCRSISTILRMAIERNRRRLMVEAQEAPLRALIHASEDSMIIVDETGTVRFANLAAEKLFNSKGEKLVGSVIGTPSGHGNVSELLIVRPQTNETIIAEMRVAEIDWGGKLSYLESIRDVTRQKKEAQEARDAIRMRDHFLATLSHELRNPLAALNNAAQVLSIGRDQGADTKLPVEIIQRQCHHMVRLLDDLLDISRLSQGKVELRKEFVSLSELVTDCLQVMRPRIEHTHDLKVLLPPETLHVHADPSRIQQVVVNLLTNAVKYTPHRGEICVRLERENEEAIFAVSDNGHGIPADLLNSIFEPFVQAEQTLSRSDGGLGIGLAVVRRLVELHGGSVAASSDGLGKGSEFTIRLPLSWPGFDRSNDVEPICSRQFHICLVEDSPDIAQMMSKLLETLGHTVTIALDGEQALNLIPASKPEVVLLDLGLPGKSGFEVAQEILNDSQCRDVILVALTGYGQPDDRRRTFEAGFHYHLVKPISVAGLQSCLIDIAERMNESL